MTSCADLVTVENRMNLLAVTLFFPPLGIILAVRTPKPALELLEIKESFFPED